MKLLNTLNKIVLVVEYDGSRYHGFQWQADLPTIQSELEQAILKVTGKLSRVIAASRTDAGVHARGQVASFWTESALSPQTLVMALNFYLPQDIAVRAAGRMEASFDVRRDAISREYEYTILNSPARSPLSRGFTHRVGKELNIEAMNKASEYLKGERDFASFAAFLGEVRQTVRTVYEAMATRRGDLVVFRMVASSFLPHQVRNTVGLLIRVGLAKVGLEEFLGIMSARKLGLAGPAAPACGLCLIRVNYASNLELKI